MKILDSTLLATTLCGALSATTASADFAVRVALSGGAAEGGKVTLELICTAAGGVPGGTQPLSVSCVQPVNFIAEPANLGDGSVCDLGQTVDANAKLSDFCEDTPARVDAIVMCSGVRQAI
jgi:hypothetical protein